MEWLGNFFSSFFSGDAEPTTNSENLPSDQPLPVSSEENVLHTRRIQNEQSMASLWKNYPNASAESEVSSEENVDARDFQEKQSTVNSRKDDPSERLDSEAQSSNHEIAAKSSNGDATDEQIQPIELNGLNEEASVSQTLESKPVSSSVSKDSAGLSNENEHKFTSLLTNLDLNPKEKFTLKSALTVDYNTLSDETLTSPSEIPKYILQKLMIVDYRARAFKLENTRGEFSDSEKSNDEDDDQEDEDGTGAVNPMDAFLALFHCCDDFLRQDLAIKLTACQLSVPFLLPHPDQPSQDITMLLWALKGIKKSWKSIDYSSKSFSDRQAFVMGHPFPIVSFARVGQNGMSKSKLLNGVISDINGHRDFFFHKDCKGGGVERKIVDGLVELCWYLPGGRKQQAFKQEICFANLRGNAQKFTRQFAVLSKISVVIFLLLPSEYPEYSTQQFLAEATRNEGKVVLVFNQKREGKAKQYFDDLKSSNQDKVSIITRASKKNEDDFVVAIRTKVGKHAKDVKSSPLEDLSSLAAELKINVDKSTSEIKTLWHEHVARWFKDGPKSAKSLLKLQSMVPTIASLERENFRPTRRGNKSVEEYSNEIHCKIQSARTWQRESLKEMDEDVRKSLNYISLMSEQNINYTLTALKHDLDSMSLTVLAPLQAEYRQSWLEIQQNRREKRRRKYTNDPENEDQESSRKKRLQDLEEAIKESSFGVEHIFREMAQIFHHTEICLNDYAGAAAEVLFSGKPLELMDGDSSYISLKWVNEVFEKLNTMTENASLFVISVLGIQSSGKSTMLNTMFGLEFPVSAGRCTRGAFASLIPLSDSLRRKSKYDYLLVIDTEGLRGSTEPLFRQHDNELATFAIGIADLTIVNIFGENYNEMKEFLEIAVHAFLKMKLVKEKRMCQIVHQNVAAIDASNELATERMTLRKKLDEMTKLAAIQEKCEGEFEELNDVLTFNENEDVSYIPSILQGCPPMAPMNPEYGKAVQRVKHKITELICSPERSSVSISQFQKRVDDLWNAILRENFIFSFRNTIEVRAYSSLDQKFLEESVKTMITEMAELEKAASVALMRSPSECRNEIWQVQKQQIRETAETLSKRMERKMEEFFDTSEDKTTLEQWRENTMIKIGQLKVTQEDEVIKNCKAVFDHLQSRQEIDKWKLVYKTKLLENAKKFITSVEASDDVNACEERFEDEWRKWINQVPANVVKKKDARQEIIYVLCNAGNRRLNSIINLKCRSRGYDVKSFGNPPSCFDVKLGKWERFKNVFVQNPQLVQDARMIIDNAIASAISFAEHTKRSGGRCRRWDLQRLYHIIFETLKEQTEPQPFKFSDETIGDILLHSFARTCPIFDEMEDKYYREHDIKLDLETNLKPDLKVYFLNQCKKMRKEINAASLFVEVLKKPIQLDINQSMGPAVAIEILKKSEFQSKGQFHAKVLIDLGEKDEFLAYVPYLRNPVAFLQEMLHESIVNYCIIEDNPSVVSLLQKQIENKKDRLFRVISNAIRQVSEERGGIHDWIEKFMENCSTLAITRDMLSLVTIDEDLKDFELFENQLLAMLNDVFREIIDRGVSEPVLREWQPQPYDKLVDLMFGCDKCCPFCKALCDQTIKNHDCQHSTRNHRPQGITGYRNVWTNVLVTSICTTDVAGNGSFRNVDTSQEWHSYREYQTVNDYYKSWCIAPDPSFEASSYWKWFLATYSRELAEHYEIKSPIIPEGWKSISFEDAKIQIRKQYNLA